MEWTRHVLMWIEYRDPFDTPRWALLVLQAGQLDYKCPVPGQWYMPSAVVRHPEGIDSSLMLSSTVPMVSDSVSKTPMAPVMAAARKYDHPPTTDEIRSFLFEVNDDGAQTFQPGYFQSMNEGDRPEGDRYGLWLYFAHGNVRQRTWEAIVGEPPIVSYPVQTEEISE